MKLHNIMEEEVIQRVEEYYNDTSIIDITTTICNCSQCKLDTTAYVLNRIKPRYIVSERGVVHAASLEGSQLDADIKVLIIEGMKKVHNLRRSSHAKPEKEKDSDAEKYMNFPIFSGLLLDGNTFEPIENAKITLKVENKTVEMFDNTWLNPYVINSATAGSFVFWALPIKMDKDNQQKVFNFYISVEADNYETTNYAFSIEGSIDKEKVIIPQTATKYKLDDLYLFPIE